ATYTRAEVALWNWSCRVFPACQNWQSWIVEVAGEILARPGPRQLILKETHALRPQQSQADLVIDNEEFTIGPGPDNDRVLPAAAVGARHARITVRDGQYRLEDLGSALGTYIDRKKLRAGEFHSLRSGDKFTIFPYSFSVSYKETWTPEFNVRIS